MKRLFILSAAVAALASCSNSEVITEVNEPQVPDKAIAFETFSSNATRAENSNASQTEGLNLHHDDFSVWGYKDVSTTAVFDRQTVNYNSSSTKWEYSPIRFWDKGANKYEFYACAPKDESTSSSVFTLNAKSASTNTSYAEDYYFTTTDIELHNSTLSSTGYIHSMKTNQKTNEVVNDTTNEAAIQTPNTDYMIADKCEITSIGSASSNSVSLHFNHILSRLNIAVKRGDGLQGSGIKVRLNSLTVNNLVANGKFDESAASENLASGTNNRWTRENSSYVSYVANPLVKENTAAQGNPDNSNLVESNEKYVLQSLVMPQTVTYASVKRDGSDIVSGSEPYIKLVYTIVNGDYEETFKAFFNLAAAFGADDTNSTTIAFNEGWQNTLHITIDATKITFDPDVYQWMDKENKDFNAESGTSTNPTIP